MCGVVERELYGHCAACVAVVEARRYVVVGNVGVGRCHEIHVAVYACKVPHVLPFKIRTVAPSVDTHRDVVVACAQIRAYVELGVGVGTLRVAGIATVYPHHYCAASSVEMQCDAFLVPTFGQREGAAVGAHGVGVEVVGNGGDARRVVLERVAHVVVDGHIVAGHLPVERHGDVVPCAHVNVVGIEVVGFGLHDFPVARVLEFPCAVERHVVGLFGRNPWRVVVGIGLHCRRGSVGNEGGVGTQFAVFKLVLVFNPRVGEDVFGERHAHCGVEFRHDFGLARSRCRGFRLGCRALCLRRERREKHENADKVVFVHMLWYRFFACIVCRCWRIEGKCFMQIYIKKANGKGR